MAEKTAALHSQQFSGKHLPPVIPQKPITPPNSPATSAAFDIPDFPFPDFPSQPYSPTYSPVLTFAAETELIPSPTARSPSPIASDPDSAFLNTYPDRACTPFPARTLFAEAVTGAEYNPTEPDYTPSPQADSPPLHLTFPDIPAQGPSPSSPFNTTDPFHELTQADLSEEEYDLLFAALVDRE